MNAIEVRDLAKAYGNVEALRGVSLEVPAGSVVGLLGVNGAGKSTLIRLLLGLEVPDAGKVRVLGADPLREPISVRARVGYLSEDRALYDWMTVDEAIAFASAFYPTWDADLAAAYRSRFDLPAGRRVGTLSRGQYARLAFLLALAHRPDLLILDEPSAGLDPVVRRQFLATVAEVVAKAPWGRGPVERAPKARSVLLASHLMDEVERVADRVAIIHRGSILVAAGLEDLLNRTKVIRLPAGADVARLDGRVLRTERSASEIAVTITDYDEAVAAGLPPAARVDDLSLEDIFCEYALAAEETAT